MPDVTTLTPQDAAHQRFLADTAEHTMEVMHDDGLYKHLRFTNNGSWHYRYDIITWPGFLTLDGDMGTWTFSRLPDMLDFFRSNPDRPKINADYWAEKLQWGSSGGRGIAREYDQDSVKRQILATIEGHIKDERWPEHAADALRAAINDEILDSYAVALYNEAEVRDAMDDFKFAYCQANLNPPVAPPLDDYGTTDDPDDDTYEFSFYEVWDWSFQEYTIHFLWCCWAIAEGIKAYDAHRAAALEPALAG